MRFRHALVVAPEKSQEVLRQVIFVLVGERSHYAEIDRNITAIASHEDIAGMHVSMKIPVAEYLGKEDFYSNASKPGYIDTLGAQFRYTADGDALYALHDHDARIAVVPVNFGHQQQGGVKEIPPQLAAVRCFTHEIQLITQMAGEFAHYFTRFQALAVRPKRFNQPGASFH